MMTRMLWNEAVAFMMKLLMEKFFNEEPFTDEEIYNGLMTGIANRRRSTYHQDVLEDR